VLAWNGTSWAPSAAGSGSGTVTSITPAADTGTGTAITTSGSITVAGTANEVETSVSGTTVTVGLPSAITVTEVNVDLVDFNTGASAPTAQPGRQYWDSTWETISLGLDANVSLKHGQQIYIRGHNSTGTQIDRGKVVHLAGGHATTEALIELADADTENASSRTVGIAAENIGHGATGFVQVFGYISGLATNGYTGVEGSALYLSSTAGDMSSTLPTQPKHGLRVGFIVKKAGGGSGSIFINIQNYQELDELSDVLISGQAEQDLLSWDNTAGVWKNRTIAAAGVAAATHTHAAADIASGTIATARLGSGTASNATFLRGDQTWATVSGGGVADADYGDITVSGTGAVWTIDPGVVGTSKLGGDITTAGKALLDDADAAAQRTTLGAAAATHTHAAGDITSGTLAVARGGTNLGTTPSNGQLLIGNGTGYTLATLTQGSNVTITNSSGAITIGATGGSAFNPATKVEVYSDFLGNNTIPWAPSTSGGSVTFTQAGGLSNPGAANMGTGTAALGRSAVGSQLQNAISLGNGTVTFSAAHFIQGNLSNSTETYVEELGFLDSVSGVFQYAVYFTYTDSLNGGRWQCICSDGLGITSVDSGVAAVADVYIRFDITVDATASSAVFKINGTTVATISNNIPTGTNRTGVLVSKRKTNGTSLRQSRLDYLYFSQDVSR
jgi:hypothetical protein